MRKQVVLSAACSVLVSLAALAIPGQSWGWERAVPCPSSAIPVTVAVIDGRLVWLFGPILGGAIVFVVAGLWLSRAKKRVVSGRLAISPLRKHWGPMLFPLAAGLLWIACTIPYASSDNTFWLTLFFLPIMWLGSVRMPEWASYVLLTVGIPGMFFMLALWIDWLDRSASPRGRARGLLYTAFSILAFLGCLAIWVNPEDPESMFPEVSGLRIILAVYCVGAAALGGLALREWRRAIAEVSEEGGRHET